MKLIQLDDCADPTASALKQRIRFSVHAALTRPIRLDYQ